MKKILNIIIAVLTIFGFVFYGRAIDALLDAVNSALDPEIALDIIQPLSVILHITYILVFIPSFAHVMQCGMSFFKKKDKNTAEDKKDD